MPEVSSLPTSSTCSSNISPIPFNNTLSTSDESQRKNHSLDRIMNNEKDDNASKVDITNSKHKSKSPSPPTVTVTSEDDTSNSVLQNIPSPTLNSTATSNESSSKKHRPSSLNLKVTDKSNSDVALRIVSPGLPQLNEEMKTTVKISQKIEQQQKNLIAARHLNSANSSSEKELVHEENNNDVDLSEPQVSTSNNNEDFDRLSTPSSAKRLKRNNIPTPLNIPNKSSVRPSIQSAPIRPVNNRNRPQPLSNSNHQILTSTPTTAAPTHYMPMTARYSHFPHRYVAPLTHQPPYNPRVPSHQQHPPHQRVHVQNPQNLQSHPVQVVQQQQSYSQPIRQQNPHAPYQIQVQSYGQYQQQLAQQQQQQQQQQPQQHMKRSYKQVAYAYQPQPSPSFAQPMVSSYGQYYQIPQHQYLNPSMQVPQYSYQNHPYKRIRMYAPPYTSSQQSFPRPVSRGAYPSQYQSPSNIPSVTTSPEKQSRSSESPHTTPPKKSPNQSSVTDVYNGDYTKAAPLNSQPLSAQRDFFENGPSSRSASAKHSKRNIHDDDRLPVSEEEVREMQEKYNSMVNNNNDDDSKNRDSRGSSLVDGDDIFGSINLMNESVFNFRIFNSKSSTSENTHNNSAAQKKGDSPETSSGATSTLTTGSGSTTVTTPVNATSAANTSTSSNSSDKENSRGPIQDRLSKEKEKFLKICETSWDEFVSNKI